MGRSSFLDEDSGCTNTTKYRYGLIVSLLVYLLGHCVPVVQKYSPATIFTDVKEKLLRDADMGAYRSSGSTSQKDPAQSDPALQKGRAIIRSAQKYIDEFAEVVAAGIEYARKQPERQEPELSQPPPLVLGHGLVQLPQGGVAFNRTQLATLFRNTYTFTAQSTWEPFPDGTVFTTTGDIGDMWLRDSAVQIAAYVVQIRLVRKLAEASNGGSGSETGDAARVALLRRWYRYRDRTRSGALGEEAGEKAYFAAGKGGWKNGQTVCYLSVENALLYNGSILRSPVPDLKSESSFPQPPTLCKRWSARCCDGNSGFSCPIGTRRLSLAVTGLRIRCIVRRVPNALIVSARSAVLPML